MAVRPRFRSTPLVLLAVLFNCRLAAEGSAASDNAIQISGEVHYTQYDQTGVVVRPSSADTSHFIALLSSNMTAWKITAFYGTNWASGNWRSEICGFGSNVYSVLYDPRVPPGTPFPGLVTPGWYPLQESFRVTMPWLAYCSAGSLGPESGGVLPLPWRHASTDPIAHSALSKTGFSNVSRRFPDWVTWTLDASRMDVARSNSVLRREGLSDSERIQRSPDFSLHYRAGDLIGEYQVIEWTDAQGVRIPTRFVLTAYTPLKDTKRGVQGEKPRAASKGSSTNMYRCLLFEGRATEILLTNTLVQPSPVPGVLSVADYRLSNRRLNIDYIQYQGADGNWKTSVDSQSLALLEARIQAARAGLRAHRFEQLRKWLLIALCGVIPFIVYSLFERRNTQRT